MDNSLLTLQNDEEEEVLDYGFVEDNELINNLLLLKNNTFDSYIPVDYYSKQGQYIPSPFTTPLNNNEQKQIIQLLNKKRKFIDVLLDQIVYNNQLVNPIKEEVKTVEGEIKKRRKMILKNKYLQYITIESNTYVNVLPLFEQIQSIAARYIGLPISSFSKRFQYVSKMHWPQRKLKRLTNQINLLQNQLKEIEDNKTINIFISNIIKQQLSVKINLLYLEYNNINKDCWIKL